MPRTDGSIIIGTSVDVGGINTGLNNINKSMKKLGSFATLAAGAAALFNFGKAALDAGSDLQEVQNVVDVAFGDMNYKMEELAKTSIETLGMSEYMAKNIGSIFMNMGRGIGFASEEASDMAIELTKRASDMASFLNISQDYARVALSAIYTGETETLKRYGIVITEANLQQFALTQGITESVKAMDSVTKARLRYAYVMQQTAHYEGDFVRTSGSWANQTRILTEQFRQLMTVIGTGLISVLTPVIQVINKLIAKLIQFANTLGTILSSIFGIKKQSFASTINDTADAADNLGGAANNAADGVGGVGDSAKDSAKKVRKALAAFDDLNQLMQKTSDSSSGADGGGAGGTVDAGDVQVETGDVGESMLDEIKSSIDSLYELGQYVGHTISMALYSIDWQSVYEGARNFGTGLAEFLNGLISTQLFESVAYTIASSLNTAIYAALAFGEEFDWSQFGTKLGESINKFFQTFDWEAFGETIRVWAMGLWTAIYETLTTITWSDVFKAIGEFFSGLGVDGFMAIAGFLILKNLIKIATSEAFLGGLREGLGIAGVAEIIAGFGISLGNLVKTTIPLAFRNFINSHAILMEVELFLGQLKAIFDAGLRLLLTGGSSTAAQSALAFLNPVVVKLTSIGIAFTGVATAFTSFLDMWNNGWSLGKTAVEGVGLALTAIGAILLGAPATVAAAVAGVVFAISQVVILIHDNWDDIKQFFADLWQGVKDTFASAWEGIKDIVSSIGSGVVSFFTETIPNAISIVIQWFMDLPSKIGYALGYALGTIASWVVNVANKFATEIPKIIAAVVNFFAELPGKIKDAIDAFKDKVIEWAGNVKAWFTEQLPAIIQTVITFFTELPEKIKGAIDAFKDKVTEWAGNVKDWFSDELPDVLTSISDWFKELPQKIYDAISALKEKIKSIGKFILDGIIEGLNAAKEGIKNFASSFVQGFKDAFQIHSPSKIFQDEVGSYLGEGIIQGLMAAINDATNQISVAMLKVMDVIEKRWDTLIAKINADPINDNVDDNMAGVSASFKTAYNEALDAWAPATSAFSVVATSIASVFEIAIKQIANAFSNLWKGIKLGLVETMNLVIVGIESTINKIIHALNNFISGANSILAEAASVTGDSYRSIPYLSGVALGKIPALAQGGVIPANSKFLALLGDQKHGTNIEAPLDTIVEAFQKVAGNQNITITFKGTMAELVRTLKPELEKEDKRVGSSFIK